MKTHAYGEIFPFNRDIDRLLRVLRRPEGA